MGKEPAIKGKWIFLWLPVFFIALIWSAIRPHDYFTWCLEVFPAILGLPDPCIDVQELPVHESGLPAYSNTLYNFDDWWSLHLCRSTNIQLDKGCVRHES